MPSFTSRHYTPDRFRLLSKPEDDTMEDAIHTLSRPKDTGSLPLVPSDGSLLDYFDLPSPPSTPQRPTHSLSFSSLNSLPSPATSPGLFTQGPPSSLSSAGSSTAGSPGPASATTTTTPRWPTASQRINRLPIRRRSRSTSSVSSSGSSTLVDVEMTGTWGSSAGGSLGGGTLVSPIVRTARRTPYYPPNSSRNIDRTRVYMHRGPHLIPNWTPLSSLPRHVQLQIEERLVRFTAD